MSRILITSGPTRQYLDPVRYLTNASSGLMGKALAEAVVAAGHAAVVVTGPVEVAYPREAQVHSVTSTEEMLQTARAAFDQCDGFIGVAAPCDYRPVRVEPGKISKTGGPLMVELIETSDIIATLGSSKGQRWVVGFALETSDHHLKALAKLKKKSCDLIIANGVGALGTVETQLEILDPTGALLLQAAGSKADVARQILEVIEQKLIGPRRDPRATEA
jgi:phosphopantothenoylcysteine decarboxylase / phosphopantothenate---cysteine ligase